MKRRRAGVLLLGTLTAVGCGGSDGGRKDAAAVPAVDAAVDRPPPRPDAGTPDQPVAVDAPADAPPRDAAAGQAPDAAREAAVDRNPDTGPDRQPSPDAVAAPFGLDQRPRNPGCVAPARPTEAANDPFPKTLRATGCVDPANPKRPAAGLIPYGVNAPLWSDGLEKERWMALPDGARIRVLADGDWDLPRGSVLVKTFLHQGKRIETRLFVRHQDGGWAGYTYEWNEAETDAALVHLGGNTRFLGDQRWTLPSREECLKCHTTQAGGTLGLETAQLNGDFVYPNGRRSNQIATLANIGMFEGQIGAPAMLPRLPDPFGGESLERRARSYLHGNCAGCHRPGATMDIELDLRFMTELARTNACDLPPQKADLGTAPNGRIIAPGKPDLSLLVLRMSAENSNRMPPLASSVNDTPAIELLRAWIGGLQRCP